MSQRLPQIFMTNSTILSCPGTKKKQGGIFQLNLDSRKSDRMNETYTAGFGDRHYKTSIQKKMICDTERNYRTLRIRDNQYDFPKEKRVLTSHLSLYRSARVQSFSVDKNPQTCSVFHEKNEIQNVTTLYLNRNKELTQLEFKMTPFTFVADQFRQQMVRIQEKINIDIDEIQKQFKESINNLRQQMNLLRKQTGNEIKMSKMQLTKFQQEVKMFAQMADQFPQKMDALDKQI